MPALKVHLVVIHHGLWGTPQNTSFLTSTLAKYHGGTISPASASTLVPPESLDTIATHADSHPNSKRGDIRLVVLNSGVNAGDFTYDGIDWCGERLVTDVYAEVKRIEQEEEAINEGEEEDTGASRGNGEARVVKLSLIGYSLGGLIVRYAAGVMLSDGFFSMLLADQNSSSAAKKKRTQLSFQSRPTPASLSTIATPHLGITETGSTFSKVAKYVGSRSLGRSGKQLYLADRGWIPPSSTSDNTPSNSSPPASSSDALTSNAHAHAHAESQEGGMCLIEALSDPRFTFHRALRLFSRIDIYANAVADLTVPYRTASFSPHDPFVAPLHLTLTRDSDHAVLLSSYAAKVPEPEMNPMWKQVAGKLSPKNLPWILNPQRIPFTFPLNYVAWVALPVLLPIMLGLVLHKLTSDSRVSNKRVEEFERMWGLDNGHLPNDHDEAVESIKTSKHGKKGNKVIKLDKATKEKLERTRIRGLLAEVEAEVEETLREVGEDYVAEESAQSTTESTSCTSSATEQNTIESENKYNDRYIVKSNDETIPLSPLESYHIPTSETPLTQIQLRTASNLNNKSLLPQVKKHLAHFEDVLNAHAVIIVRTTTMETHRKGMGLIKAFVERFGL
ncbi:uncharacterized protein MEPE_04649 [Melanopsichium pennsylvanicum]|uniref:DUF676 domain-containing protein n=2 Tax=Melanopsichium pennsylvanicum TaxID=63383 RepID=A0AAJ4XNM4_9BASI|nr:conserved hypothetical protein [Melanopsichium pennsylvanicum 4]SNX85940.1 uncharacterized protein MEPE_04649 [Melanopsichium pennsylvanicum]